MFYRGVIHTYDFDINVGEIYIKEQSLTVKFNLKDLPNATISPQIGERVKFIIVDENNQKFAKYIIRLDNKNANTDQAVLQAEGKPSIENSNIIQKDRNNENAQKPKYVKKTIALNKANSESEIAEATENLIVSQKNEEPQLKIDRNIQQNKSVGAVSTKHSKAILQQAETRLLQKIISSNLQNEKAQTVNNSKYDIERNLNPVIHENIEQDIEKTIHHNLEKNTETNLEKSVEVYAEQNIELNNTQSHVNRSVTVIPDTSTSDDEVAPEFELNFKILNEQQLTATEQENINSTIENDSHGDEKNSSTTNPMPEFELNFEKLSKADESVVHEDDRDLESITKLPIDLDQKKGEHTEATLEEFELDFGRLATSQIQSDNQVDADDSSNIHTTEEQNNGIIESTTQSELLEFELNFNSLNINQVPEKNDTEVKVENDGVENNQNNADLYSELLNVDFELNFDKLNKDLVILEGENSLDPTTEDELDKKVSTNESDSTNSQVESIIIEDIQKLENPLPPVLAQANMVNTQNSSDNKNFPSQANIKKLERLKDAIGVESEAETNVKPSFKGQVKAPDPDIVADIQNKNKTPLESKVNYSINKQNQFSYDSSKTIKKKVKKKKSEKFGLKVLMGIIGSLILINGSLWGYQKFQQYKADQEAKLKIYTLEQERKIEEQRRALGKLPDRILSDEALDDLLGKDRDK